MNHLKAILAFTLLISLSFTSDAQQITWDKQVPDTVFAPETKGDVEAYNKITVQDSGTYRWVRKVTTACPITTAICDKNQCYLEHVDSAEFFSDANETFTMIAHFYPNNDCCKYARIDLLVYKVSDPSVNSTATYQISLWCTKNSSRDLLLEQLSIHPNPAKDMLTVDSELPITNGVILNSVGQQVKEFEGAGNVSISELSAGIYYLQANVSGATLRRKFVVAD